MSTPTVDENGIVWVDGQQLAQVSMWGKVTADMIRIAGNGPPPTEGELIRERINQRLKTGNL